MRILIRFRFLCVAVVIACLSIVPAAQAGLLNANLAEFHDTDTGFDGEGVLGGGLWNRINFRDAARANRLLKSDGSYSRVFLTETSFGNPTGATQDGNDLQDESWGNHKQEDPSDRDVPVEITISGLIPRQVYRVAVYSDRLGSESGFPDTYTVNGIAKAIPLPGPETVALPGVEGIDYALFIIDATEDGSIVISAPFIASLQIEGVIDGGERGPQLDCLISRAPSGARSKGNDIYRFGRTRSQTLVKKTSGRRAKRFYVKIENDGDEIDRGYATANWAKRAARVKIFDRHTGKNVTAAFRSASYRYVLESDDARRFAVKVKPTNRRRTRMNVPICASSSTIYGPKLDCVNCVLKVR